MGFGLFSQVAGNKTREMDSSCARGGSDWILGKVSSPTGLLSTGTGCPGQWLRHHPWRCLEDV